MIKYVTGGWGNNLIKAVEVEKETDVSVWVKGSRCAKRSTYKNYFDTWEEAKQFLLGKAEAECDSLRSQLERAKGKLGNIKGLKTQI